MPQDIIADSGELALGSGWYPLEVYLNQRFRWVENNAVFYTAMLRPAKYIVKMTVEPGPGLELKPFALKVSDGAGEPVATLNVKGRQPVQFEVIVEEPTCGKFRLHVDGGGATLKDETRVLNFRVFEITLTRGQTEVLPAGVSLGTGWYPLETFNGETFRWVSNDAEIRVVARPRNPLAFEVEPGPGVDSKPFTLKIVRGDGAELLSTEIRARQPVNIPLPDDTELPAALRLRAEGGGKRTANDSRIMNFRVFRHSEILQ